MCDKISYSSRAGAIEAIKGISKRLKGKRPHRAYLCRDGCGAWHITSGKQKRKIRQHVADVITFRSINVNKTLIIR